jgi:uncharacterized protein YcbX
MSPFASQVAATQRREVGRVKALYRYPVKSMAAEPLDAVDVAWHGMVGDRRWALVHNDKAANGFPWLTLRDRPDLNKFRPRYTLVDKPNQSPVMVRDEHGEEHELTDPEFIRKLGDNLGVLKLYRGTFDVATLSMLTTRTVSDLGELIGGGGKVDVQRFRPNLLIEPTGDEPFPEDNWVGCVMRIGSLRMRIDQRNERCAVVNVDPETGSKNPQVLRAIAKQRDARLGVYGSTVEPGRIAVGDPVIVESAR